MQSSLIDLMEKYKEDYLQKNGKNTLFKKNQKMDCAKEMSQTFSLQDMIQRTIYNIPNTNKIVFDYNVYKLYAHPDNFDNIVEGVICVYDDVLSRYATFEVHMLLNSFSMSAAERYKGAINSFCNRCMNANTMYSNLITNIFIYHTPSMIEAISTLLKPFIDQSINNKIIYYSKAVSDNALKNLFA
jgi:hypothetical protein